MALGVTPDGGKTLAVINPADESVVAEVAYGAGTKPSARSMRQPGRSRRGGPFRPMIVPRS